MDTIALGSRVIIYCNNYADIHAIRDGLSQLGIANASFYGMMSSDDKAAALKQWIEQVESMVMTASSSFGLGKAS